MREKLKRFWGKLKKLFDRRLREVEQLLAFEIKKRKELEHNFRDLQLKLRRLTFDINKQVDDKIENYEELFEASKTYGENLLNVAVAAHKKINEGEKK